MDTLELVYWDHSYNQVLLLNLVICIALFTSIRLFSGVISHVNASDQLAKKDNPAFGISMAGVMFAVTPVLISVMYGDPQQDLMDSVIAVGVYGVIGIALMALTRVIFDRVYFPGVSIRDEIEKKNIAAGVIDAGNVIATAIIIRAVMMWVHSNTLEAIQTLIIGYIISQLLLSLATMYRNKMFAAQNDMPIQDAFKDGNTALALRFAGRRIGMAFAITAASYVMIYEVNDIIDLLLGWTVMSLVFMALVGILSYLAQAVILIGINVEDEVVKQKNIALGAVQGAIYLCFGLIIAELIG